MENVPRLQPRFAPHTARPRGAGPQAAAAPSRSARFYTILAVSRSSERTNLSIRFSASVRLATDVA